MDFKFNVIETIKHEKANEFINECKWWHRFEVIIRLLLIGTALISYGLYLLSCKITVPFYLHSVLRINLAIFCVSLFAMTFVIIAELVAFASDKTYLLKGFFCKTEKDWLKHSLYFHRFSEGLRLTKQLELENKEIIEMKISDWDGENRWHKAEFICRDKETGKTESKTIDLYQQLPMFSEFHNSILLWEDPELADEEMRLDLNGFYPAAYVQKIPE